MKRAGRIAWLSATLAVSISALSRSATAQVYDANVRVDQLEPASAFSPFGRAEGPHSEFEEGIEYAFRLSTDYQVAPLRAELRDPTATTPEPHEATPVEHALLLHLGAALAPVYWLSLEAQVPFALFETGDPLTLIEHHRQTTQEGGFQVVDVERKVSAGGEGIGDPSLGAWLRPLTSEELDAAVGLRIWIPLGMESAFLRGPAGFMRMDLAGSLAGEADSFLWGCTLALSPFFLAGRDGDRVGLSCAGHFNVTPMISVGLEPHAALFVYQAPDLDKLVDQEGYPADTKGWGPGWSQVDMAVQVEPLAAGRLRLGGFSIGLAAGPGFGGAPGTPIFRGVLTLAYQALGEPVVDTGPPDADLDGILDADDACPKEAGPADRHGCPAEQDTDGDGIIKGDACPDEPGARSDNPKANGCPDRDNDRVADPIDACPEEPGTKDGCPRYARLIKGDGPTRFEIDPPIRFERRSAELRGTNIDALREIVRTMRAHPELSQISIAVGAKGAAQRLTDNRAKTILTIVGQEQDLDTERFEVVLGDELANGWVTVRIIE